MGSWNSIIIAGSLWFTAFAALVIVVVVRLEANTRAMREISERMQKGHKSCDELPEASQQESRAAMIPPSPAHSSGSVAVVSSPDPSGRSFPGLPRPNDDDREPPEHSEVEGESRIRARSRTNTLGALFFKPNEKDDSAATRRLPRVTIAGSSDESTDIQRLPTCAACGSIDVAPIGGLFGCNACGKVGPMQRQSKAPSSPEPPLFVG